MKPVFCGITSYPPFSHKPTLSSFSSSPSPPLHGCCARNRDELEVSESDDEPGWRRWWEISGGADYSLTNQLSLLSHHLLPLLYIVAAQGIATNLRYLSRMMNRDGDGGGKSAAAPITRNLLGGCCELESKELDLDLQVPNGWEKRLDLKDEERIGGVGRFEEQFEHLEEYYGKRGRSTPLRRHYTSVPRERVCALKDEESDDDGAFEKRMGMPYAETVHICPTTSQRSRESAKDVSSKSNDCGRRSDNGHVVSRSTTLRISVSAPNV